MEAVARVYLFKQVLTLAIEPPRTLPISTPTQRTARARAQTAHFYEAGKCDRNGRGKKFDIAHLWDVLRTMRPTREMCLAAWSHSLEYSIGTSSMGVNCMNAVCEKLGLNVEHLFRRMPKGRAEEVLTPPGGAVAVGSAAAAVAPSQEYLDLWMNEARKRVGESHEAQGAYSNSLALEEERLREARLARNEFRRSALDRPQSQQPMQSIGAVMGGDPGHKYSNALFPTFASASLYYAPKTLLMWATGKRVTREEAQPGRYKDPLQFKTRQTQGGSTQYDFAWLSLRASDKKDGGGGGDRNLVWSTMSTVLKTGTNTCSLFDMHTAGIADALFMLASSENSRLCPEMQWTGYQFSAEKAFVDENSEAPKDTSLYIGLRKFELHDGSTQEAHAGAAIEARQPGHAWHRMQVKVHEGIDRLNQRCRLPALQPHMSTRIVRGAPLRKLDGGTIEVNSVVAFEHVSMVMESVLRCSHVPGLEGLQERFASGGAPPSCYRLSSTVQVAMDGEHAPPPPQPAPGVVNTLPYAIDIMQMAWTIDLGSRFYSPSRADRLRDHNDQMAHERLDGDAVDPLDLPQLTTRYPGFPTQTQKKEQALRQVSLAPKDCAPPGQAVVDIAKANSIQDIDYELLRYETEITLGRPATTAEIEDHRRTLLGNSYVWDVSGDVFSYDTWCDHLAVSLLGRGNTSGEVDEYGEWLDTGFATCLDPENMFAVRLLESRAARGDADVAPLKLHKPRGSTYGYLKRHPTTLGVAPGQPPKANHEAPRMVMPASKRMAFAGRAWEKRARARGEGSGAGLGVVVEDGDSREGV